MLAKENRFHGYNSLRFVYNRGQTVRGTLSSLKYALNERRETYRCAVVVSKKVNKSAVARNRIRRRVYEVVRGLAPRIKGPYDIVITIFSEQFVTMPAAELERTIKAQLKQAHIIGSAQVRHVNIEPKEN